MAQRKGQTGNPNGRPKGTKNKKTEQWEVLGASIMNEHTEKFNNEMSKLQGEKFMDMYIKVLEYFKPKQNRTDITTGGEKINPPKIAFFDTDKQ
jgi:hypothetical protein